MSKSNRNIRKSILDRLGNKEVVISDDSNDEVVNFVPHNHSANCRESHFHGRNPMSGHGHYPEQTVGRNALPHPSQSSYNQTNTMDYATYCNWNMTAMGYQPQYMSGNETHFGISNGNNSSNYGYWNNQSIGQASAAVDPVLPVLATDVSNPKKSLPFEKHARPVKRVKLSKLKDDSEPQLDDDGNEPVDGFMTLTPKGCSPNSLVCRINEDLRSKFGYSGRPVTYSRFCQHFHTLKFPGHWVLSLVVRNINPIKVGEHSVFISKIEPKRCPDTAPKPLITSPAKNSRPKLMKNDSQAEIFIDLEEQPKQDKEQLVPSEASVSSGSKKRKRKTRGVEDELVVNRPRGVFPGGVQPHSIVVLVDEKAPYIDTNYLTSKGLKVINGRNLSAIDYIELINKNKEWCKEGVLFVVVPWLAFMLKHFELFPSMLESSASDSLDEKLKNITNETDSLKKHKFALLNLAKDFQTQLHPQDLSTLTSTDSTSTWKNSGRSGIDGDVPYARRVLMQHVLSSALLLRNVVRSSHDNSDVVFCGFPVHAMSPSGAWRLFKEIPGSSETQVSAVCSHVLASIYAFNEFAANTWKLGYVSKIPSFNSAPEPRPAEPERRSSSPEAEIEILSESQNSDFDVEDRASRKKCAPAHRTIMPITLDDEDVTIAGDIKKRTTNHAAVTQEQSKSVPKKMKDSKEVEEVLVYDSNSGSDKRVSHVASRCDTSQSTGHRSNKSALDNSSAKTLHSKRNTEPSLGKETLSKDEEDCNILCIDNTEVFEDEEDHTDEEDIKIIEETHNCSTNSSSQQTPGNSYQKKKLQHPNPRKNVSDKPVVAASIATTLSSESSDDDDSDTEALYSLDESSQETHYRSLPLTRLISHRWFGKRRKLRTKEDRQDGAGLRRPSGYVNRNTEDASRWFMEKLQQLLKLSSDFARNRGSMVPWETPGSALVEGEELPGAVRESLRVGVYSALDSEQQTCVYRCLVCCVVVGDAVAADQHAYTWPHCDALGSAAGLDTVSADLLLGRSPIEGAVPLSQDYLERAVRGRVLQRRGGTYSCLLCRETPPAHALRHHVSSRRHLTLLNASLGLTTNTSTLMSQQQHWRLYRDLLSRHPAMDVVIVTDEVNHCVVQSLCRHHPRVGVLSYPDFLRDPAGRMAAVKQLQQTWNSFPVTETEVNNSYSSKTDVNNPSSHSAVLESVNGSDRMKDLNNQTSSEPPTNGTNGSSEPLAEAKTDKSSDDGSSEPLAEAKTDKSADDAGNSSIATSGMPSIACISTTNPSMECDNINEPVAHCVPGCVSPLNELSQQEDSSVTRFVDDEKRSQATPCATDDSRAGAANDSFNGPSKEIALEDDIVMEDNEQPGNCEKFDCDSRIECNSEKMSQPERNVLWLIVTGIDLLIASDVAEEFADIDEIMSHVYDTHAYLRLHVPPRDVVLTTPVLPLTILQDTLPRQLISHLMNGSNAITAPPKKFDKIVQLYKLLFCRSLALHAANAAHENLFRIAKGALGADVVRILTPDLLEIKDSQTDVDAVACATGVSAHYFTYTSWHVAVENVIVNAIYGSPCPFLSRSPAAVAAAADQAADIDAMEHTSRLCQISVVGELKFERSSSTAFKKVSLHKRWLQFDASDRAFILQLAEKTSGNNPMTWCLTAPFPKLVMQHFPNPSCVVNRCKKGLRLWQFQAPKSDLLQAQLKMRSFLTELQCKLPDGNFANVFPAYPCSFVVVNDKTDKDTHSAIHRLHRSSCNTFFTRESEDGIRAMFDGLATAWRSIFSTNKLDHTLDSACEGLASVSVYQLDQNASIMHRNSKAQVDSWLKAVTAYLADYHHEISVQLTKPAEASTDDLIVLE